MIKIVLKRDDLPKRLENLQDVMFRNMLAAANIYLNEAKRVVGVSAGGASKKARAIRGNPSHEKYEEYRHSKPGEPPRKITGWGQQHIVIQAQERRDAVAASVSVGVQKNAWYMAYLDGSILSENKPRRIAPRPWVRPTYSKTASQIERTLRGWT